MERKREHGSGEQPPRGGPYLIPFITLQPSAILSYERSDYRCLHQVLYRVLLERAADHRACTSNVQLAVRREKFLV